RIVTTLHGTDITVLGYDLSLVNAIRFGIEGSDAVTAVSDGLKSQTMELICPDKDIETVYNFVEEQQFNISNRANVKQDMKNRYGIAQDVKVLMHTSNFRKIKCIDDIIHAFAIVKQKIDSVL